MLSMDAAPPPPPSIFIEPLRLGLLSDVPSRSANEPGCSDRVETIGSLTAAGPGSAMQFTRRVPIPFIPRLTLVGFSRAGCPIDAAIGTGATYVVPLRPSVFFVMSSGVLVQPPYGNRPLTIIPKVRADVVFDRGEGRSWSVGVQTIHRHGPGITFGGIF
jgi:hypothetical protein